MRGAHKQQTSSFYNIPRTKKKPAELGSSPLSTGELQAMSQGRDTAGETVERNENLGKRKENSHCRDEKKNQNYWTG